MTPCSKSEFSLRCDGKQLDGTKSEAIDTSFAVKHKP